MRPSFFLSYCKYKSLEKTELRIDPRNKRECYLKLLAAYASICSSKRLRNSEGEQFIAFLNTRMK